MISTVYVLVERLPLRGGLVMEMDDATCTWTWRTLQGGQYTPIGRHGGVGSVEVAYESSPNATIRCLETTRNDSQGQVRLRTDAAIALYGVNSSAMVVGGWGPNMSAISGSGYLFVSGNAAFQGEIQWRFIQHP
jgi:hypothetical protein